MIKNVPPQAGKSNKGSFGVWQVTVIVLSLLIVATVACGGLLVLRDMYQANAPVVAVPVSQPTAAPTGGPAVVAQITMNAPTATSTMRNTPTPSATASMTPTPTTSPTSTFTPSSTDTATNTPAPATKTALARLAAKIATAAMATKVAGCGSNTPEAEYLGCFVLFANEAASIHQVQASLGIEEELNLWKPLIDHVTALKYPRAAQSMHNAFLSSIVNEAQFLVALEMGDSAGAQNFTDQYGERWGNYVYARLQYLNSIGTTVEAAGFVE